MSLEKFLGSYVGNITTVIEWLFLSILCLVAAYLYRSLRQGGDEASSSSQLADIEKALKRVLDQVPGPRPAEAAAPAEGEAGEPAADSSAPAPEASAADAAVQSAELAQAKKDRDEAQLKLAQANNQIEELKNATASAPAAGGNSSEEVKAMESRVRELEGKLSDYEIIADDIANLSLYKSENARLKDELNRMKNGGANAGAAPAAAGESVDQSAIDAMMAAAQTAAPAAAPDAAPAKDASTRAALEALVEQVHAEKAQVPTESAADEEISIAAIAEIQTPAEEPKAEAVAAAPAPASEPPKAAEPAAPVLDSTAAKSVDTPPIGDDIMAEFAEAAENVFKTADNAVTPPPAVTTPAPAAAPVQAAPPAGPAEAPTPAAPPAPAADPAKAAASPSALDVKLDADTVANEMAQFAASTPAAKKTGDDATLLIEEFENFMKTS